MKPVEDGNLLLVVSGFSQGVLAVAVELGEVECYALLKQQPQ